MNVYIEAEYFDLMAEFFEREKHNFSSAITNNIRVLINMFSGLKINTTLNNNDIVKFAKGMAGDKNFSSMKDIIISRAIKNQTLNTVKEITEIKDFNGFYFTKNSLANNFNVVSKDKEYNFAKFYDHCNQNGFQFNGDVTKLSNFISPTNAMIIVDPYIFDGDLKDKLGLLIEFVNLYKSDLSGISFQLTILTKGTNENNFNNAFAELSEIENIEIEIVKFDRLEHDREIFTNYSFLNIGVPFVKKNTNFNQNFLAIEHDVSKIQLNYSQFREKLSTIKNRVDNQPAKIGLVKYKWSNINFSNRLFEMID